MLNTLLSCVTVGNRRPKTWHHPATDIRVVIWITTTHIEIREDTEMNYSIKLALVLIVGGTFRVNAQSDSDIAAKAAAVPGTESNFLVVHQEADPRFILSIERTGPCTLRGAPLETSQLRVPISYTPENQWINTKKARSRCNSSSIQPGAFARRL